MALENQMREKPKVVLFSVYDTLLDTSDLQKKVNSLFDNKRGYIFWFELCMQYCFVENCTEHFNDFNSIAKATLQMAGITYGKTVTDNEAREILNTMRYLPVNAGVQDCLSQLNEQGYQVAALTNSTQKIVSDRMESTGLISYFETVLSAEHIRKYKPCPEVYRWAAQKMKVSTSEILLASAHSWDIAGGVNVGMKTAYLKHKKQMLYPLTPAPDLSCKNLEDLVRQLEQHQWETPV